MSGAIRGNYKGNQTAAFPVSRLWQSSANGNAWDNQNATSNTIGPKQRVLFNVAVLDFIRLKCVFDQKPSDGVDSAFGISMDIRSEIKLLLLMAPG